jgi:hypothetical protein
MFARSCNQATGSPKRCLRIKLRGSPEDLSWKRVQAQNDSIELQTVSEKNHIKKLIVKTDSIDRLVYDSRHPLQIGYSVLTFASESVNLDNRSFYVKSLESLEKLERNFESRLLGLQNGNSEDKDYVQQKVFREALIEFKRVLRGDNIRREIPCVKPSLVFLVKRRDSSSIRGLLL